jgi:hypothetical protein
MAFGIAGTFDNQLRQGNCGNRDIRSGSAFKRNPTWLPFMNNGENSFAGGPCRMF